MILNHFTELLNLDRSQSEHNVVCACVHFPAIFVGRVARCTLANIIARLSVCYVTTATTTYFLKYNIVLLFVLFLTKKKNIGDMINNISHYLSKMSSKDINKV